MGIFSYLTNDKVILCSFGSKRVILNEYDFPRESASFNFLSSPNSETCTNPATPSSIETRAQCLLNLITTPFTVSSFLYLSATRVQGFSVSALIESEIFPSLISITLALTLSPSL